MILAYLRAMEKVRQLFEFEFTIFIPVSEKNHIDGARQPV